MAIPEKWLHITPNNFVGHLFINRIFGMMHELGLDWSKKCSGFGLNISDKICIIERGWHHIEITKNEIYDEVLDYDDSKIFNAKEEGFATKVNNEIISDFLLHADSVIFEMKIIVEITIKLFDEITLLCDNPKNPIMINSLIQLKNGSFLWYKNLKSIRNHFTHNGCPYFAIDISESKKDILIMKKNIKRFDDEIDFIRLSQIKGIYDNLLEFIGLIFTEAEDILRKLKHNHKS